MRASEVFVGQKYAVAGPDRWHTYIHTLQLPEPGVVEGVEGSGKGREYRVRVQAYEGVEEVRMVPGRHIRMPWCVWGSIERDRSAARAIRHSREEEMQLAAIVVREMIGLPELPETDAVWGGRGTDIFVPLQPTFDWAGTLTLRLSIEDIQTILGLWGLAGRGSAR